MRGKLCMFSNITELNYNQVYQSYTLSLSVCTRNETASQAHSGSPLVPDSHPPPHAHAPPQPAMPILSRKRAAPDASVSQTTASGASPAKKSTTQTSTVPESNPYGAFDRLHESFQSNAASAAGPVKSEPQLDFAIAMDDDDDDDIIWDEADAATSWAADGVDPNLGSVNGFNLDDSHQHFIGKNGLNPTAAAVSDEARRYCPTQKELFEAKVQRLKSLRPDEVFVKRSREHQLLSTVMYGFGRDLALEFVIEIRKRQEEDKDKDKTKEKLPLMLSKANYFHKKYENFVLEFPELTGFKTKIKRSKNQIVSAGMYIKNIAQKAFYKRCKKEEDIDTQVRKASENTAGGAGGGGAAATSVATASTSNGSRSRHDSTSNGGSFDDVEAKVETGLINPITGFPCPEYDQDEDDDDIIFL